MAIVRLQRLGKLKKISDDLPGNSTRDLPACSVSAPTNYATTLGSWFLTLGILLGLSDSIVETDVSEMSVDYQRTTPQYM
jgi:hypothetical protein